MKIAPLIGLGGIILAVLTVDLNDQMVAIAIGDVSGGLGLSHDHAAWLGTIYVLGEIVGTATAATLARIFTMRRFALFTLGLAVVSTVLVPLASQVWVIFALRLLQGLAGGFALPLLMATALRVLNPRIRLWGLAAYTLSATVAPNLSTTMAALWVDGVEDWRFLFFGTVPFATAAAVLVWFGMEQDPPEWGMLKRFDWPGALLVAIGFGSLAIALEQGDRLDWFNSTTICLLLLTSALALPMLVWRQLSAPQPLFDLRLFRRPNFAYGVIGLMLFLIIAGGASVVPTDFLVQVHGYRPLQTNILTLTVALSQFAFLPLAVVLLDRPWIDARWVSAAGYLCILAGLVAGTFLDATWLRQQFVAWQIVQSLGFALVIMPLLMLSTNVVKQEEAMYASGMFNCPRALSEAISVWVVELVARWRGGFHRDAIASVLGDTRFQTVQAIPVGGHVPALTPQGAPRTPGALADLQRQVTEQVTVLTTIDTYVVLAAVVVVLMIILAVLPTRSMPPRIELAKG